MLLACVCELDDEQKKLNVTHIIRSSPCLCLYVYIFVINFVSNFILIELFK